MLVLALDTTTRRGSIALVRDGIVLETFAGDASITHGERLPGDLARVIEAQHVRWDDIDLFAVAAGPGSFTGLRIGIAAMQGLALANDRPLVGVSALDAIDAAVRFASPEPPLEPGDILEVWMDAQRGQVFAARYQEGRPLGQAAVDKPDGILGERAASTLDSPGRRRFAGDGAILYRDLIERSVPGAYVIDEVPPLAPAIAQLAEARAVLQGPSLPDAIRPIYVRKPDAELARDRRV